MLLVTAFIGPAGVGPLSAQSGTSVFTEPDQLWVVGGYQVPAIADTFALMSASRYPVLELGTALSFRSPLTRNIDLTIYIYPLPAEVDDPVQSEFETAVAAIYQYAASRGPEWSVSMKREEGFVQELDDGGSLTGMMAEAEYYRSAQTSRTFAYVFQKADFILKYRITYDSDVPEDLWDYLEGWMRATASLIERYPG